MREAIVNYRAKKIVDKYKTYSDFSSRATPSEKKTVLESTLFAANKLQRRTVSRQKQCKFVTRKLGFCWGLQGDFVYGVQKKGAAYEAKGCADVVDGTQ